MFKPPVLDPSILSSIAHLEMTTRRAVEGSVSGLHHSHFMGRNVEFSEYRPYNPGDELRLIDWRAFAKTDRYYVKQFEEDTNLRALLLTDFSGSMWFGESTSTKAAYAQQLAAALSYLMIFQGDSVGLCTFDETIRTYIPPRNRSDQWGVVLETLAQVEANTTSTNLPAVIDSAREYCRKRGLVIFISDFIAPPEEVLSHLALLGHMKQEVIVFHVLSPEELDMPWQGTVEFRAMEGNLDDTMRTAPKRLRERYRERVQAFVDTVRSGCLQQDIDYTLVRTDVALDDFLREYLQRRIRQRGSTSAS